MDGKSPFTFNSYRIETLINDLRKGMMEMVTKALLSIPNRTPGHWGLGPELPGAEAEVGDDIKDMLNKPISDIYKPIGDEQWYQ